MMELFSPGPHSRLALFLFLVVVCILNFYSSTAAAPLKNVSQTLKQPDGTVLHCFASGDEYYHWLHDKDNYTIIQDPVTGFFVYAVKDGSKLVSSGLIAGKADPASAGLNPGVNISYEAMEERRGQQIHETSPLLKERTISGSYPTTGTINNIVIFVRFSDDPEFSGTTSQYNEIFNSTASNARSVIKYFKEVSYGRLSVTSSFYPASVGASPVSYKDTYPRGYYQPYNSISNPSGYQNGSESRARESELVKNALQTAAGQVSASLDIDNNNDGYIDNISFIVYGSNTSWSEMLWPHMNWFSETAGIYVNGKKPLTYNFFTDDNMKVSVIVHEMFHSFGAPDLYRYNMSDMFSPVGQWDIMSGAGEVPPHMGAFMKYRYGKWISQIPEITAEGKYSISPASSSENNCYKIASPDSKDEYYVVEYRKKEGTFEYLLPGSGLLVYRINSSRDGRGNAGGPPDEVYLYRPGGDLDINGTTADAFFSKSTGRTYINDASTPSGFLSNGQPGGLNIHNLSDAGDKISFFVSFRKYPELYIPDGNEKFLSGEQAAIKWIPGPVENIKIEFSPDNGATWQTIAASVPSKTGVYFWNVPSGMSSDYCLIKISDVLNPKNSDISTETLIVYSNIVAEYEPNNSFNNANYVRIGSSINADIVFNDPDYYKMSLVKGDTVDVRISALGISVWPVSNSLYSPSRTLRENFLSSLQFVCDSTGDYYIKLNYNVVSKLSYTMKVTQYSRRKPDIHDVESISGAYNGFRISAKLSTYGLPAAVTVKYGTSAGIYTNSIEADLLKQNDFTSTIRSLIISGLQENRKYYYKVTASNGLGETSFEGSAAVGVKSAEGWIYQNSHTDIYLQKGSFINMRTGMLAGKNGEILRTDDGGKNWKMLTTGALDLTVRFVLLRDSMTAIAGCDKGTILRSSDGGNTWHRMSPEGPEFSLYSYSHSVFFDAKNGLLCGPSGVLSTNNGGDSWTKTFSGYKVYRMAFYNRHKGSAIGDFGNIYTTEDGGLSWTKRNSGTSQIPYGISYSDSNNIFVALGNGTILRSKDAGKTWASCYAPASWGTFNDIAFTDSRNGIASGDVILVTSDGGDTWKTTPGFSYASFISVICPSKNGFLVTDSHGEILRKGDLIALEYPKGSQKFQEGTKVNVRWFHAGLKALKLEYSINNGSVWNLIASDIPADDGSYTWTVPGTPSADCRLRISDASNSVISCQSDSALTIIGTSGAGKSNKDGIPHEYSLYQNYPNPFNPATTISYALPEAAFVSLKVYDILGKEVSLLENGLRPAGIHSIQFNAETLPSGLYIYSIQTGKYTASRKLMLLR